MLNSRVVRHFDQSHSFQRSFKNGCASYWRLLQCCTVSRSCEVADNLINVGKELADKCEDLYERSGDVAEDATHELSGKYHALRDHSRQLLDEAETILRRTKSAAVGR